MKKFFLAVLAFFAISTSAKAAQVPIDIRVNGDYILTHSEPIIHSGISYAPLRSVADSLGARDVLWDHNSKTATVITKDKDISINTFTNKVYVNNSSINLNGECFIHNDRTYIPVRAIAELFDADVSWDSIYNNVEIQKNSINVNKKHKKNYLMIYG